LLLFAGGRWNFPLATWLVPVFAIRFFRDSEKAGRNFLLLWLATAIPTIISWNGATFLYFMHPAVEAAFFLLMTPLGLIPYVVDRLYYRRFGSSFWLTLVYPVAATAMDFSHPVAARSGPSAQSHIPSAIFFPPCRSLQSPDYGESLLWSVGLQAW